MIFLVAALLAILSYAYGSLSTARIITKSFRSLNIYKVGSGLADTENIYSNISKPLGVLVGALDVVKSYVFLLIVETILRVISNVDTPYNFSVLYSSTVLLGFGVIMLTGHCLPITNKFRGGRGIFTYMGLIGYFAFYPMLITAIIAVLLVTIYRQIRFAQYLIVILPAILAQVFYSFFSVFRKELPPHFLVILLGVAFFMGILNIIVSKRLGEF
ncbi:MAG: hypothetical protein CVU48_05150 [Candidatus Cloacimonetes bacterium HGW-Cloacimonetes-1]|jgi:glycerol-3-phosphate acyltransferase PlsY|nr:MAG: hypothetical protein CVU48_05150 [Candidatus Cloacimonetes bacterium HGW-Cloacimonetes-1]